MDWVVILQRCLPLRGVFVCHHYWGAAVLVSSKQRPGIVVALPCVGSLHSEELCLIPYALYMLPQDIPANERTAHNYLNLEVNLSQELNDILQINSKYLWHGFNIYEIFTETHCLINQRKL